MVSRIGEALTWLGIAALLLVAAHHQDMTGNDFLGLFAGAVAMLLGGLFLMNGTNRRPR